MCTRGEAEARNDTSPLVLLYRKGELARPQMWSSSYPYLEGGWPLPILQGLASKALPPWLWAAVKEQHCHLVAISGTASRGATNSCPGNHLYNRNQECAKNLVLRVFRDLRYKMERRGPLFFSEVFQASDSFCLLHLQNAGVTALHL